jgi:hypothetical protein
MHIGIIPLRICSWNQHQSTVTATKIGGIAVQVQQHADPGVVFQDRPSLMVQQLHQQQSTVPGSVAREPCRRKWQQPRIRLLQLFVATQYKSWHQKLTRPRSQQLQPLSLMQQPQLWQTTGLQ